MGFEGAETKVVREQTMKKGIGKSESCLPRKHGSLR